MEISKQNLFFIYFWFKSMGVGKVMRKVVPIGGVKLLCEIGGRVDDVVWSLGGRGMSYKNFFLYYFLSMRLLISRWWLVIFILLFWEISMIYCFCLMNCFWEIFFENEFQGNLFILSFNVNFVLKNLLCVYFSYKGFHKIYFIYIEGKKFVSNFQFNKISN